MRRIILTFGSDFMVRQASVEDIDMIKQLADAHKHELGFLRRPALLEAIDRQELLIVHNGTCIIGFVEYRHRRDHQTTLYNIVIHPDYRRKGFGYKLVKELEKEARLKEKSVVQLKCPVDLLANSFYERIGYQKVNIEPGKSRQLNIWQKALL